jgi:hypothetical protein
MRRALTLATILVGVAGPVAAQPTNRGPSVSFLPRSAFHMTAEHLSGIEDERFRWDANLGGELDLVDYTSGRLIFAANYQAILGEELKLFDPNQGNYTLQGVLTARVKRVEAGLVLHHLSRHLSDRDKTQPVDWNMLGGRLSQVFLVNGTLVDVQGDLRWTIQHSYVDYTWELDTHVRVDRLLKPGVGVLAAGSFRHLGVDGTVGRDGPNGFRAEGGVRFEGSGGAVELFVGAERRIDPYPLEFGTATWMTAGFRLLSR